MPGATSKQCEKSARRHADDAPVWGLHGELSARPPGRLGRMLLPEIESYLEFFAISREVG
jgi:hypothetical protein